MFEENKEPDKKAESPVAQIFASQPSASETYLEHFLDHIRWQGTTPQKLGLPRPRVESVYFFDERQAFHGHIPDVKTVENALNFVKSFAESYFRSVPTQSFDRILGRRAAGVKQYRIDQKTGKWRYERIGRPADPKQRIDGGFEPFHGIHFHWTDMRPLTLVADKRFRSREENLTWQDFTREPAGDPLVADLIDVLENGFTPNKPPSSLTFVWIPVFQRILRHCNEAVQRWRIAGVGSVRGGYRANISLDDIDDLQETGSFGTIGTAAVVRVMRALRSGIGVASEAKTFEQAKIVYGMLSDSKSPLLTPTQVATAVVFLEKWFIGAPWDPVLMEAEEPELTRLQREEMRETIVHDLLPRYTGKWDTSWFNDELVAVAKNAFGPDPNPYESQLIEEELQFIGGLIVAYEPILKRNRELAGTLHGYLPYKAIQMFPALSSILPTACLLLAYLWTKFGDSARTMIYIFDYSDAVDYPETNAIAKQSLENLWLHHPLLKKEQLLAADLDQMARDKFGKTQEGSKQARAGSDTSKPLPKLPTALAQNIGPFLGQAKLFRDNKSGVKLFRDKL
jgi:hypothetical protein